MSEAGPASCGWLPTQLGCHPGGDGVVREIEVLADCTLPLQTERRERAPWAWVVAGTAHRGATWSCEQTARPRSWAERPV